MITVLITLACLVVLAFLSVVIWTFTTGISPMPSSKKAARTVAEAVKNILRSGPAVGRWSVVVEAGSGWGTLLLSVSRLSPEIQSFGYELSPLPFAVSYLFFKLTGRERIEIRRRDFRSADLKHADIVIAYLHPEGMNLLADKIEKEVTGTVHVVSNNFQFRQWEAAAEYPVYDAYNSCVYVYKLCFA